MLARLERIAIALLFATALGALGLNVGRRVLTRDPPPTKAAPPVTPRRGNAAVGSEVCRLAEAELKTGHLSAARRMLDEADASEPCVSGFLTELDHRAKDLYLYGVAELERRPADAADKLRQAAALSEPKSLLAAQAREKLERLPQEEAVAPEEFMRTDEQAPPASGAARPLKRY